MKKLSILIIMVLILVPVMLLAIDPNRDYRGITIRIAVMQSGRKGAISGPLYDAAELWNKETGGKVEIVEIPFEDMYEKIMTDLIAGTGYYDGAIIASWWLGDLVAGDYVVPIDEYYEKGTHPVWKKEWVPPALAILHEWKGKWYGPPNDSDGQILYYRYDLFTDPEVRKKFKEKYGYDIPVPPRTWDQVLDLAEFFTGWDWNNDGEPDYGFVMHLKVHGQAFFHFMSLSAPFVINPYNPKLYWFDPIDMKPLIKSPGHRKALELLLKLHSYGPPAEVSWDLGEAWDFFLRGKAAMTFTWGDLGSLAQDESRSKVKGKLGCTIIPGTYESYDIVHERWVKFDKPNIVGNTTGASWYGVIFKHSKHPEAVYDYYALMARRDFSLWNISNGWTGVDPGLKIHFLRPLGEAKMRDFLKYGWDPGDVDEYLAAYYENFFSELLFPYLRIPGTPEYWDSLDIHLSEVVSGQKTINEALDAIYKDWEKITKRLGRKEQLKLYRESINWTEEDDKEYLKYHKKK